MSAFKRERRYCVLKLTDLRAALTGTELRTLSYLCGKVRRIRAARGKKPLKCVVVESDWPEYKMTWHAIKMRVLAEQHKKQHPHLSVPYKLETQPRS